MSHGKHPTLSAWQRDERGNYKAEMNGWTLVVKWRPESPDKNRGFWWEAEKAPNETHVSRRVEEEMEIAMANAEAFAKGKG